MIEYTQEEMHNLHKILSLYNEEELKERYKDHIVIENLKSKLTAFLVMFVTEETTFTFKPGESKSPFSFNTTVDMMPSSNVFNHRLTKRISEWKDLYLIKLQSILFDTPHEELPHYIEDDQKEVSIIAAWRLGIGK